MSNWVKETNIYERNAKMEEGKRNTVTKYNVLNIFCRLINTQGFGDVACTLGFIPDVQMIFFCLSNLQKLMWAST